MNGHIRPLPAALKGALAGTAITAALGMTALGMAACGSANAGGPAQSPAGAASGQAKTGAGAGSAAASGGLGSGGPTAPAPVASGGAPLCPRIPTLDRVIIFRTEGAGTSHMRTIMPLGLMVKNVARVRELASALCALPPMPPMMSCPAAFRNASFRLAFWRGRQQYPVITVQTTGCRAVTGLGAVRWWARTPTFWPAMMHAIDSAHGLLPLKQGSVPTP